MKQSFERDSRNRGAATLLFLAFLLPVLMIGFTLAGDAALVALELRSAQQVLDESIAEAMQNVGHFSMPSTFSSVPDRRMELREVVYNDIHRALARHPLLAVASRDRGIVANLRGSRLSVEAAIPQPLHLAKVMIPLLGRNEGEVPKVIITGSAKLSLPQVRVGINFAVDKENAIAFTADSIVVQEAQARLGLSASDTEVNTEAGHIWHQCNGLTLLRHQALAIYRVLKWMEAEDVEFYSLPSWRSRSKLIDDLPREGTDEVRHIGMQDPALTYADGFTLAPLARDTSACIRLLNDEWLYGNDGVRGYNNAYLRPSTINDQRDPYLPDDLAHQLPTLEHFIWALSASSLAQNNPVMIAWRAFLEQTTETEGRSDILLLFASSIAPEFTAENRRALLELLEPMSSKTKIVFILASTSIHQGALIEQWRGWAAGREGSTSKVTLHFLIAKSLKEVQLTPFKALSQRRVVLTR